MKISMTMNVEHDEAVENSSNSQSVVMYKPLPAEAGTQYTNELFFPLYRPDQWSIFNQTPENIARLGLTSANPLVVEGLPILYTFFFKIPTHPVQSMLRPDGSTGFTSVICPKAMNDYLVKNLERKPMFENTRCAFCEAASQAWEDHNKRWTQIEKELGVVRRDLQTAGYTKIRDEDPILKATYKRAKQFKISERYVLMPFDHGKFEGSRQLDEGEETATYLPWLAPKAVATGMKALWKNSVKYNQPPFFDFDNPQGLQVLAVVKNTEECSSNNMMKTKYNVMTGPIVPYEADQRAYLTTLESTPDPSNLLAMLAYQEAKIYAFPQEEDDYNSAPAQAPVATPAPAPVAAPAPVVAPPVVATPAPAPVAAPAPVVAPPVVAAPAPAPVAPTMPAPAPVVATPAPAPVAPTMPAPVAAPAAAPAPVGLVPSTPAPAPIAPPGAVPAVPVVAAPAKLTPTMPAPSFESHAPINDKGDMTW